MLKNDREIFEALLKGYKVERMRGSGFGRYLYLNKEGNLVDEKGKPSNLFKLNISDNFQIYKELDNEKDS